MSWSTDAVLRAFALTAFAGLSTGFGSTIALLARRTNKAFLGASLGFSAGVMVYISFVDLLPEALRMLEASRGPGGRLLAILSFFTGIVLIAAIDFFVPEEDNPHDAVLVEDLNRSDRPRLRRLGLFTAVAIGIHNFPEGLAAFFSALEDPARGTFVAVAIAIHNIPEGIAVSAPVLYATGSRRKAFWWSFLSGVSEPAGALVGWLVLRNSVSDWMLGAVLSAVAGVMVFISLDQLIPNAKRYEQGHSAMYGLVAGMAVMALSLEWLR